MSATVYLVLSGVIFAVVAVLHVIRGLANIRIQIGNMPVPKAVSWAGACAAAALSAWAFLLASR